MNKEGIPTSSGREEQISSDIKNWLESPFTVYHKKGLVEKIQTENGEPEFIVNLKKGLVSQIQLDLSKAQYGGRQAQDQNQIQRGSSSEPIPVFKTEETSILGRCETIYSISKLPAYLAREFEETESRVFQSQSQTRGVSTSTLCEGKEYYEILKTKNLDRCVDRPVYHESYGVTSKSDGTGSSTLPSQSSVTRTIICGSVDNHIIRKSVTENSIISSASGRFESKEKIDIYSVAALELESVERIGQQIATPSSPKTYPSLGYEYPSGSPSSSKSLRQELAQQQQQGQQQKGGKAIHAPLPDMTSAPSLFFPRHSSQREIMQKTVETFSEMIETTKKMSESRKTERDVAAMSVAITRALGQLSYDELREVKQTLRSQYGDKKWKSTLEKVFFDMVAMAGSNPCMKLVLDQVQSGEINEDAASWSWILSSALRNVKTPTSELLEKLVETLKTEAIQRNRVNRAAYAMGLTELVHKACISSSSMQNEFAYKIYGQMCNKEMSVIKDNLVPYLAEKLQESSRSDTSSIITWVQALGNIGLKESSEELIKVAEGRIYANAYPRSAAIYTLIRPALVNPSVYRPVFNSIVENSAESPEVRIAAITALTYSYPSTADLQKLAIRTWFEPSRQVASFITSTLKSLSTIPASFPKFQSIKDKATGVLSIAKPSHEGYQYSHNTQISQYIESIRSGVSHNLLWASSEESFLPKFTWAKAKLDGLSSTLTTLESAFYVQGAEEVIEKLYEMYSNLAVQETRSAAEINQNKRDVEELMSKLGIQGKPNVRPEAFLTLKFMGLQKLFSIDEEYVSEIVRKISSEIIENGPKLAEGVETEYFKVLDLVGSDYVMPTETGMPVYITVRNPTVAYNKAVVKGEKGLRGGQIKAEIEIKGSTNYKRQIHAGVISPITGKFHCVGVETSLHIAVPTKVEVSARNGLVQIALKNTEEPEYQNEQTLLEFDVHPFIASHGLSDFTPINKGRDVKSIKSQQGRQQVILIFNIFSSFPNQKKIENWLNIIMFFKFGCSIIM